VKQGLHILLEKKIPVAAGMAGGSSDAAATMIGVNDIFALGLSEKELMDRAVKIGADVPYCIMGGTALAEGIGEVLSELPPMPDCYILIAKPPIDVPTKFVYGNLRANELKHHPDIDKMIKYLADEDLEGMCKIMGNVLETVTVPAHPVINDIKRIMRDYGAVGTLMSGSGPTVFGIFKNETEAQMAEAVINYSKFANEVYLTVPKNR
jgi:4-diphosphocytidyl-2-C-methyl-D-erythritol kinase